MEVTCVVDVRSAWRSTLMALVGQSSRYLNVPKKRMIRVAKINYWGDNASVLVIRRNESLETDSLKKGDFSAYLAGDIEGSSREITRRWEGYF